MNRRVDNIWRACVSETPCVLVFLRLAHDMTQSREVLAMMDAHTTTFGRKRGCTISRCGAFLLAALFLICLVVTGLLVYHFASCLEETQTKQCGHSVDDSIMETALAISKTSPRKRLDVRLPRAVAPDLYEIWLIPFIWEGNFTFNGEVTHLSI